MGFYADRVLPRLIGCACQTKPIAKQREKIVPAAHGTVVDIGFGTGTNLAWLNPAQVKQLIGIEPHTAMIDHGRPHWRADIPIKALARGGEDTGLEDASADTVLITFTLCTVPDPQAVLAEATRILKPEGQLIICEHGLADDAGVQKWQKRIEPIWKAVAGGCHLTRNVTETLAKAQFDVSGLQSMYLPGTPRISGYSTWGTLARPH